MTFCLFVCILQPCGGVHDILLFVCVRSRVGYDIRWRRVALGLSCVLLTGVLLGVILPHTSHDPPPWDLVSSMVGWSYFVAWSVSFYPQVRPPPASSSRQPQRALTSFRMLTAFVCGTHLALAHAWARARAPTLSLAPRLVGFSGVVELEKSVCRRAVVRLFSVQPSRIHCVFGIQLRDALRHERLVAIRGGSRRVCVGSAGERRYGEAPVGARCEGALCITARARARRHVGCCALCSGILPPRAHSYSDRGGPVFYL